MEAFRRCSYRVVLTLRTSNGKERKGTGARKLTRRRTPWYCVFTEPMSIANGRRAKKPASSSSSALNPGGS